MKADFINSIEAVSKHEWQQLWNSAYPFIQHDFLQALEHSGSTSAETGWQPQHLLIRDGSRLLAALPLFIKTHSYGEYVFDWAWADAYHRSGLQYYPKLVTAIPFTPATGPRLAIAGDSGADKRKLHETVLASLAEKAAQIGASSWHCLFPREELHRDLFGRDICARMGCQYHWFNQGFTDFDAFLSTFASRKRKNLKKERARVGEQGIELEVRLGGEVSAQEWELFYQFYHLTYFKRSGRQGYLGPAFFPQLARAMPEQMVMVLARYHGDIVAAALNFRDDKTLYGRYWGCRQAFDALHFEACYYQGIEYAIGAGLERFDPGAQGEHKIQRGFTPTRTWSNHWIADHRFRAAIEDFVRRETLSMEHYIEEAKSYLPFRKEN